MLLLLELPLHFQTQLGKRENIMSEGDVKPQNPVVAEAHAVDTFHVPKAFYE